MISRRQFLTGSLTAAGSALGVGAYARWGELHWVEFVNHDMPVPGLPRALAGQTLVQLSDLHIGPRVSDRFLLDTFTRVQERAPALVAYTGDFVTFEGREQLDQVSRVMRHAPRGSAGTVAIFGNHDYGHYWSNRMVAAELQRRLEDLGITVIRNSVAEVAGVQFVGYDDLWSPMFGGAAVMTACDHTRPTIVLCHNPDACDLDVWGDYRGWILSGHTHGGQVSLPFIGAPILPVRNKRYVAGEYELDAGRMLYINRALGHSLEVRFGVRPEVTLHRLQVG